MRRRVRGVALPATWGLVVGLVVVMVTALCAPAEADGQQQRHLQQRRSAVHAIAPSRPTPISAFVTAAYADVF